VFDTFEIDRSSGGSELTPPSSCLDIGAEMEDILFVIGGIRSLFHQLIIEKIIPPFLGHDSNLLIM
jgi:hypothetical protein